MGKLFRDSIHRHRIQGFDWFPYRLINFICFVIDRLHGRFYDYHKTSPDQLAKAINDDLGRYYLVKATIANLKIINGRRGLYEGNDSSESISSFITIYRV